MANTPKHSRGKLQTKKQSKKTHKQGHSKTVFEKMHEELNHNRRMCGFLILRVCLRVNLWGRAYGEVKKRPGVRPKGAGTGVGASDGE